MITNLVGDVTKSKVPGLKLLVHCCNSLGLWNSGVVVPIAKKWPITKESYLEWYQTTIHSCEFNDEDVEWMLGNVQFVQADEDTIVCNMIGQKGVGYSKINGKSIAPVRYDSVREGMEKIAELAKKLNASIICPKFCSLRAGGDWNIIEEMINEIWGDINVTVYEFTE